MNFHRGPGPIGPPIQDAYLHNPYPSRFPAPAPGGYEAAVPAGYVYPLHPSPPVPPGPGDGYGPPHQTLRNDFCHEGQSTPHYDSRGRGAGFIGSGEKTQKMDADFF